MATNRYVLSGEVALTEHDVDMICVGDAIKTPIVRGLQAIQAAINREPAHEILLNAASDTTVRQVPWATFGNSERLRPILLDQLGPAEFDRVFNEGSQLNEHDAIAPALAIP